VWRPASVVFFKAKVAAKTTLVGAEAPTSDKATVVLFPLAIVLVALWVTT